MEGTGEIRFALRSFAAQCRGRADGKAINSLLSRTAQLKLTVDEVRLLMCKVSAGEVLTEESIALLLKKSASEPQRLKRLWSAIAGKKATVDKFVLIRFFQDTLGYNTLTEQDFLQMFAYKGLADASELSFVEFRR